MIKRFVDFDRESFEELKEFFLELIDEGCKFEKWNSLDIHQVDGNLRAIQLLKFPNEEFIKRLSYHGEVCLVKLDIELGGGSNGWEKRIQQFLNSYNLGILNLIPQNLDISYIDYQKFFQSDHLKFIESVSGFKLSYVSRSVIWNPIGEKISYQFGMVFVR